MEIIEIFLNFVDLFVEGKSINSLCGRLDCEGG
jgi:hypothetical protein